MAFSECTSEFIENQCVFGSYPTSEQLIDAEKWGINMLVDTTNDNEKKIVKYTTDLKVVRFPIKDRGVPENKHDFCRFIITLSDHIESGRKIWVHCKGGHGRSGIVVASLLAYTKKISSMDAIILTTFFHSQRKKMREWWRCVGAPQTTEQKLFVHSLFVTHLITPQSPMFFLDMEGESPRVLSQEEFDHLFDTNLYLPAFLLQTHLGGIVPSEKFIELVGENEAQRYADMLLRKRLALYHEIQF
jgi:hypothetical protein